MDRLQHVKHRTQPLPGGKTAPPDVLPMDPGEIQLETVSQQNIADISTDRGDRDHGPRVVDHDGGKQQGAMEPPENQAECQGYPGMEPKHGIEGDGQAQAEAHRDLFRRDVGLEDLVL